MTRIRSRTALHRPYARIVGGVQPGFSPAPDCVKHESIALTEDTSGDPGYLEAVSRQALETNERLKDLFTGETVRP